MVRHAVGLLACWAVTACAVAPQADPPIGTDMPDVDGTDPPGETDTDGPRDTGVGDPDTDAPDAPDPPDPPIVLPTCPTLAAAPTAPAAVGCDAWPAAAGRLPPPLSVPLRATLQALGDVTGDGIADVLKVGPTTAVLAGGGTVEAVLRGAPVATIARPVTGALWDGGDLNGDGLDDVVAVTPDAVFVWWAPLSMGEGIATADVVLSPGVGEPAIQRAVVVGDLDGDGQDELVVVQGASPSTVAGHAVHVVSLDGGADGAAPGDVARATWTTTGADDAFRLEPVRVGDLDGDGDADLVLHGVGAQARGVYRMPWPHGGGTLSDAQAIVVPQDGWRGLTVGAGDVDGDGAVELLLSAPSQGLWVVPDPPPGTHGVEEVASHMLRGDGMHEVKHALVQDVDQDGVPDLVVSVPYGQTVACQDTDVSWQVSSRGALLLVRGPIPARVDLAAVAPVLTNADPFQAAMEQVELGDVTGDGVPDVLVGDVRWSLVPQCPAPWASSNDRCALRPLSEVCGAGLCLSPWDDVSTGVGPRSPALVQACADDGAVCVDGGRNLVGVTMPDVYRDRVLWFDQDTRALVAASEEARCGRRWYGERLSCTGGGVADCADAGVCAALVTAGPLAPDPGEVCDVWPHGVVHLKATVPWNRTVRIVPDLTGDGVPDVLSDLDGAGWAVHAGGGSLTHLLDAWVAETDFGDVDVGDLDGDGQADLIVVRHDGLSVYLGPVSGLLDEAAADRTLSLGARTYDTLRVVGDLDGDGLDEVVGTWRSDHTWPTELSVFDLDASTWDGWVNLEEAETVHWFVSTGRVAGVHRVGDLNGDGSDELIAFDDSGHPSGFPLVPATGVVWWVKVPGLGGNLAGAPSVVGRVADARLGGLAVAADLDGDGQRELLLTTSAGGSADPALHVLHGIPGPFTPVQDVAVATFEGDLRTRVVDLHVAQDLDGDGVRDLLVSSRSAGALHTCTDHGEVVQMSTEQGGVYVVLDPLRDGGRPLAGAGGAVVADTLRADDFGYGRFVDLGEAMAGAPLVVGGSLYGALPTCP